MIVQAQLSWICVLGLVAVSGCTGGGIRGWDGTAGALHRVGSMHPHAKEAYPSARRSTTLDNAIVGLDRREVEARLGPPTTESQRGLGRAMEYRDRHCSIELTLYPEVKSRVYRALAYQVSSNDHTHQSNRACLERFAARIRER